MDDPCSGFTDRHSPMVLTYITQTSKSITITAIPYPIVTSHLRRPHSHTPSRLPRSDPKYTKSPNIPKDTGKENGGRFP